MKDLKLVFLEENMGGIFMTVDLAMIFLCVTPKGKKKDEFYLLHQIKNFCPSNDTIRRVKRQPAEKRSICESCI